MANEQTTQPSLRGQGFWAVLDMTLFTGANFLTNVLLARWLNPAEYGAFAVAYAVLTLLYTVQTALLTEPMLIFGAAKYANRFPEFLKVLLRVHWLIIGWAGIVVAVTGLGLWWSGVRLVGGTLLVSGAAIPCILLAWFARRAYYVVGQPSMASAGSGVYALVLLTGLAALAMNGLLTVYSALAAMGLAGALVGVFLPRRLCHREPSETAELAFGNTVRKLWTYGRWSTPASLLSWVPVNAFYVILPLCGRLEDGGALRALMNLVLPGFLLAAAVESLLLPSLSRQRVDPAAFARQVRSTLIFVCLLNCGYGVPVALFSSTLLHWLYGTHYTAQANLVSVLVLTAVLNGMAVVLGAALRAQEQPRLVFRAYLVSAVVALTIGVGFAMRWGAMGTTMAILLSFLVTVLMLGLSVFGRSSGKSGFWWTAKVSFRDT